VLSQRAKDHRIAVLVPTFFLLGFLDAALTMKGILAGGTELNPLARLLIRWGWPAFFMARVMALGGAGFVIVWFGEKSRSAAQWCAASLCVLFGAVDAWSVAQLLF
jgi:hypothetical protein